MMKLHKKITLILASITLTVLPGLALAEVCATTNGTTWFNCVITNLLNIVVWPIFITASIIMFMYAGVMFFTAQGDPSKVHLAGMAALWATVGIVVGLLGYVAVAAIRGALGL